MSIEILLVHTCLETRNRQAAVLGTEDDIHIIAEADSGQEALHKIQLSSPDVVVIDPTLPDMSCIQVTRQIMSKYPDAKVLLLTKCIDENCFYESLAAGVRGYLTKGCAEEDLAAAIRTVYQGKPYFCAEGQELLMKKCLPTDHQLSTTTKR